ncbi:hypothetical protein B0H17DRAFT_1104512 [Mycena rosella]|uniref:Elongator complex protein 5 n=1 Tax=Mycena rosella TaxID=1033263 RepID=A0AAD7C9R0_MYCRO|nr:hypothetical protein B0H17DRAFT_1104512 [Mycena rosella]
MFSPFELPSGILLLVTDQLSSPADFVLHRALAEQLKSPKSTSESKHAIVLSVSEHLARWKAIAAKSNVHLDQHASFLFLDVLGLARAGEPATLRPVLDAVVAALKPDKDTLVILDDLAALEWLGIASVLDLTRFVRALHAACRARNATLLIRHHVLAPEPDDALRALREQCTFHMEVLPLASGRSGAVSGQVALHAGPGVSRGSVRLLPRSAALQYKLTEGGAVFFERGTGAGVL